MSTQHTPRPWLVKPVAAPMSHNGDIGIVTAKGALIAVALLERGRAAANARLIAHGSHSKEHNATRIYRRGYTLNLSSSERAARSARMREMRRAAVAKATGGAL